MAPGRAGRRVSGLGRVRSGWRRRLGLVAAVTGLVVVAGPAPPAAAHAVLLETNPAAGTVLDEAPEAVTLRFNEPVSVSLGGVRLLDESGERVDDGRARRSGDGTTLTVPLAGVPDGAYVVAWRVVSADSHPVRGAFVFRVGEPGDGDEGALLSRLLGSEGEDSSLVGALLAVVRFGAFAGLSLLVGTVAFVALVWSDGAASARVRRLAWGAWALTFASTLGGIVLQGPYVAGLPLRDGFRPSVLGDVLSTRFGEVWAARAVLLLVALPLLWALRRAAGGPPRWWVAAGALCGAALVLTPGLAGHAATGDLVPLALAADGIHVGAVAVWLGGLGVLVAAVLPSRRLDVLQATVPRFSTIAFGAVVAIVVTGVFQSWRQVRGVDALTATTYGRLLIVKVLAFGALIGLAAVSRQVVRRRLAAAAADRVPAGPGALRAEPDAEARRQLRRSVGAEVAVAGVVLALTALLVNAVPAREALARPFSTTVETDKVVVDVTVDPARAGEANAVHLYTFGPQGAMIDPPELTVTLTQPERDIGPLTVALERAGPGHFVGSGVAIPLAGNWRLDVVVRLTEFEEARGSTTFSAR